MSYDRHLLQIPCDVLPLTIIAEQERTLRPVVHVNRVAPFHILIYILKGSMEIIEDGETYHLTPRTLAFLKAGVHHWGEKPFEIGTSWLYAHFYAPEVEEDAGPLEESPIDKSRNRPLTVFHRSLSLPKLVVLPEDNQMREHMEELVRLYQSSQPMDSVRMNLKLWDTLLYASMFAENAHKVQQQNRRIRMVEEYLAEHMDQPFSSGAIEELLGLSYNYICTLFRQTTGMTMKEYHLSLRIQKASRLLGETGKSVAEIAALTGFYDAFHFSKMFKREKGTSPLKFRENYVPGM